MQASAYDPDLVNHYSVFLYPLVHQLGPKTPRKIWDKIDERWDPWWSRLNDDQLAHSLEGTSFFLPYVQRLLFPELCHLQQLPTGTKFQDWIPLIRRLTDYGLATFVESLPREAILRLTLTPVVLDQIAEFDAQQIVSWGGRKLGPGKTAGKFDWIDLILFPSGLGFLMFKARLRDKQPLFSQLIQLNRALQLVHGPSLSYQMPTFHFAEGPDVPIQDLIDRLLVGIVPRSELNDGRQLHQPIAKSYTGSEIGRAYGERCYTLSYGCVDFLEEELRHTPKGTFADGQARMLFEFGANIPLGETVDNPMWVPSPAQAEKYGKEYTLSLWRCWKAMALKGSLVFLATENLPFTRRSLPGLIETDYLPLYAYTLYQRFQLSVFTNDLMREVALVDEHLRGAKSLLQRFVAFRNQYMFSEITRKPQATELYRMLHHGLEIECLSTIVNTSVKEAKEFYQEQWDRQMELTVKSIGFIGGPLVATYGAVRYFLSWLGPMGIMVLLAGVCFVSSLVLFLFLFAKPKKGLKLPPPLPDVDERETLPMPPTLTPQREAA